MPIRIFLRRRLALDGLGRRLGTLNVHTSLAGYKELVARSLREVCEPATDVAPVPITTILISLPILSEIYNPPPSETASCDKHQENMPA